MSDRFNWIRKDTAEINAAADAISALQIGDGVSVSLYTDSEAFTIIGKTAKTITLRCDHATLLNKDELKFVVGGFAAHCQNQEDQRYDYAPNPDGHVVKITLRCWNDAEGNQRRKWKRTGVSVREIGGSAFAGRRKFHDYNF